MTRIAAFGFDPTVYVSRSASVVSVPVGSPSQAKPVRQRELLIVAVVICVGIRLVAMISFLHRTSSGDAG
jgi:hypothetical protein